MIRLRGALEVLQVATHARIIRGGQVVVVVDVAVRALARRNGMRSGQREPGCRVVKRCRLPCSCVVAGFASLRESAAHVVRIRGALEILQVT